MKVTAITLMTDPEYRQDPWEPALRQMLLVFDEVVVACGAETDRALLTSRFGKEIESGRLRCEYLHWPQPEWTFDELPRHLNAALRVARREGADWVVKLDIDTVVHEDDRDRLYGKLEALDRRDRALGLLEKYQFITSKDHYEKGKLPFALNVGLYPTLCYGLMVGQDGKEPEYSDLCQPGLDSGERVMPMNCRHAIPKVRRIGRHMRESTGVHAWNYDYTIKTQERAAELLYHFDRAHAAAWGVGFGGRQPDEITRESAMDEFMALMRGRRGRCNKVAAPDDHPYHMRETIRNVGPEHFGFDHWGNI